MLEYIVVTSVMSLASPGASAGPQQLHPARRVRHTKETAYAGMQSSVTGPLPLRFPDTVPSASVASPFSTPHALRPVYSSLHHPQWLYSPSSAFPRALTRGQTTQRFSFPTRFHLPLQLICRVLRTMYKDLFSISEGKTTSNV